MATGVNHYGELRMAMFGRLGVLTSDGSVKVIEGRDWKNLTGEESLNDLMGQDVMIGSFCGEEGEKYFFMRTPENIRKDLERYN